MIDYRPDWPPHDILAYAIGDRVVCLECYKANEDYWDNCKVEIIEADLSDSNTAIYPKAFPTLLSIGRDFKPFSFK